jgi:heterokaryon incompatibility protein (HET)
MHLLSQLGTWTISREHISPEPPNSGRYVERKVSYECVPPKYIYQPLHSHVHIQIIYLQPSEDPSQPLYCSILQTQTVDNVDPYECISYTWGPPILECLHCDDGSVFNITSNLHSAIVRFRSNSEVRPLWADAVCIDQANVKEKSPQVPLMARIYREARGVLVWLGDHKKAARTMDLLIQTTKPSFISTNHINDIELRSIAAFFKLTWFSRLWKLQEIVFSPDVLLYCGSSSISWVRLLSAIEILSNNSWDKLVEPQVLSSLSTMNKLWKRWTLFRTGRN